MFESPRSASPLQDGYIQPNLGHGLRIWWAYWWPTFLLTVLANVLTTILLRRIYENSDVPGYLLGPAIRYNGYFYTYVFSFFMLALVLRKNFRSFRVGLLSHHGGPGAEILPPNFRRTLRVWWAFTWRDVLYRVIATGAVMFPLGWILGFLAAIFRGLPVLSSLVGLLVGVATEAAVGLFVIYSSILDEDISDFRVALLPPAHPAAAFFTPPDTPAAPTPPVPTPAGS